LITAAVLLNVRVLHPASGWFVEVGTVMPLQGETGRRFSASSEHSYGEALDEVVPRLLEYLRVRGVRGFQAMANRPLLLTNATIFGSGRCAAAFY
jgi:hypothetical protein